MYGCCYTHYLRRIELTLTPERRSEIVLENIKKDDCGIIALQALSGLPRTDAEIALTGVYQPGVGVYTDDFLKVIKSLGFDLTRVPYEYGDTVATFALRHEVGTYLIFVKKHVISLVDGTPHNSRAEWHTPVLAVHRVSKR
jgi:hypothetical protein